MTEETFRKIVERAGQLATCDLNELRLFNPAGNGSPNLFEAMRRAVATERTGADERELRRTHVAEILEEEFGYLVESKTSGVQ